MIALRYWVMASVVVVGTAIVMVDHAGRSPAAKTPAATATPRPGGSRGGVFGAVGRGPDAALGLRASWALSALPECLVQKVEASGTRAFVRSQLPAAAVAIAAPVTLAYRDCTIRIRANDALVRRGADRFYIPPVARFYRLGNRLLLFHYDSGAAQLRTYVPSNL
ncbi:MAG TPA: hypothetical protein VIJ12_10755 [Candidatus Baltobacteraceae bacterium]